MSSKICSMKKLSLTLDKGPILDNIDWEVRKGEHWAVLGANGAGKTTLFMVLAGEVWPDDKDMREYFFEGKSTSSPLEPLERFRMISPEHQDIFLKMGWIVTGEEVVLAGKDNTPFLYRLADDSEYVKVRAFMADLGMADLCSRDMLSMSRGEGRKIMIARALMAEPEVLILDEFLEGIDQASRADLLKAIDNVAKMGTTIICSAHRKEELPECINNVMTLKDGRVVTDNKTPDESSCSFRELESRNVPKFKNPEVGEILFDVDQASVVFLGKTVLKDISWKMKGGESWAVLGKNGAGKSTLLRLLHGDAAAYAAEKKMVRLPEKGASLREAKGHMGLVSASLQASFGECVGRPIKVKDLVVSGIFASTGLLDEITDAHRESAAEWMKFFGIDDLADESMTNLSYGQLRKGFIARAMIANPDVLLLDEPLAGLDEDSRKELYGLLEKLTQAGVALVYVTHHKEELIPSISHVLELTDGKVSFSGKREDYFNS